MGGCGKLGFKKANHVRVLSKDLILSFDWIRARVGDVRAYLKKESKLINLPCKGGI